jgi:hypothetical protein
MKAHPAAQPYVSGKSSKVIVTNSLPSKNESQEETAKYCVRSRGSIIGAAIN